MTTSIEPASLESEARARHLVPFWPDVEDVRPSEPRPNAVPYAWRYAEFREFLERATEVVIGAGAAERRALVLANPAMDARHTTDGVLAAVQLILPGEVAAAHRHTASAIRFVISGNGAYTQVGGARMRMGPGDLVITPSRDYHDHGNSGKDPACWLDALDLPLFHMLPANFSNPYRDERYPAVEAPASPLIHRWADMKATLDGVDQPVVTREYLDPRTNESVLRNLRATATRISAGAVMTPGRETASGVFQVIEGSGHTVVGDERLPWEAGDVFAIPAWSQVSHAAAADSYLFRIDEAAALRRLGMYMTEADLAAGR